MARRLSYTNSPMSGPFIYQTVGERLRQLAEESPTRDAFVFCTHGMERVPLSRLDLYNRSNCLAKVLVGHGLKKGQTVGFCMNNSIEMLVANFAVIIAGGIPFFMATSLRDGSDIVEMSNFMEASMLVFDANEGDDNWKILERLLTKTAERPFVISSVNLLIFNGSATSSWPSTIPLSALMAEPGVDNVCMPSIDPEDVMIYFCTSGSTGKPKAVAMTHFCLINYGMTADYKGLCISPDSVHFCDRSFNWGVGYPKGYIANGATRVFVDTKLTLSGTSVASVGDIIEREKCDVVYIPNYITVDLSRNQHLSDKFKTVNTIYCSGERLTSLTLILKDKFCKKLIFYYGSTEAAGVSAFSSTENDEYEDGIIGIPLEGQEMKVVDSTGRVVEVGTSGELHVRSIYRFVGYKGLPDKYAEVVDTKNWFHTGDMAHMRADGCFVMEGRSKEVISMQTNKIFPWDIEKVLRQCQGVKKVVVVGVPDERLGQVICACLVLDEDISMSEDDVRKYCDDMFLDEGTASRTSLKPKYILLFGEIPLTFTGKIDRLQTARIARERLEL